ncbi:MAG TPA: ABC transporter ATP-binding protein [Thermoplasmatales archaeon]|nr:ABC transporter ATP-binding protein [Thermoplasmatales archaeon]
MTTKLLMCPYCGNTISIEEQPVDRIYLVCPKCGKKGVVRFKRKNSMDSILWVKNLTKYYNNHLAVNNVSFSVKKGEIFGFLGPNGAGKTTTIKAMLGLIHVNEGEVKINGFSIAKNEKEAKSHVGYLPERVAFYGNLTALQNLYFYAEMRGASKEECKALLEEFGLGEHSEKKVSGFSKGMLQRLGMARAMLGNPSVLILDEPTSGLDPRGVVLIRNKIKDLNKRGVTLFVSSHILSEVQAICDHVGIINRGVLVAEDSVSRLSSRLNLKPKMILELNKPLDVVEDVVRKVKGVDAVHVYGRRIEVVCDAASKVKVVLAAVKAGADILNIRTEEPSLEEVFMRYTGG